MWFPAGKSSCTTSFAIFVVDLYRSIKAKIDFISEAFSHGDVSCSRPLPADSEYMKSFHESDLVEDGSRSTFSGRLVRRVLNVKELRVLHIIVSRVDQAACLKDTCSEVFDKGALCRVERASYCSRQSFVVGLCPRMIKRSVQREQALLNNEQHQLPGTTSL